MSTPRDTPHTESPEERLTPGARRILDVASELFYARGLHAVGVDTIAAESGVTKRTLYDRFGSKDALITRYLRDRDQRWRADVAAALDGAGDAPPARRALVPFDVLADWLAAGSRGCGFVHAHAELPDPDHPARAVITGSKRWLRARFRELAAAAGAGAPDTLAVQLLSLHEGALVSHTVAGEPSAVATAREAAALLLRHAAPAADRPAGADDRTGRESPASRASRDGAATRTPS